MEHTIVHFKRAIERERKRADFLEAALRNYASHAWNDIRPVLDAEYPRAEDIPPPTDD